MKRPIATTTRGLLLGALLLTFGAAACSDSKSPTAPSTPAAPTLAMIQTQIFDPACASCHTDNGRTPAGGTNLRAGASFGALVNIPSTGLAGATRVIPGNPSGSYLVQKLEGASNIVGLRMPRTGPPYLTDAQVKMIRDWIQAGALNN